MKSILPTLLLIAACSASTYTTDVYQDPAATQFNFQRVAAIAIAKDPNVRRSAEDAMVQRLGEKGVASYTLLSPEDERNADSVRAKLQSLNIDGAVTMALLSAGDEPLDVRGDYSDSAKAFTGYYGARQGDPVAWEKVVRIETQIFSVTDNKLLWSAATKTFRPGDAKQIVEDVAGVIADELRKSNLIR